MTANNAFDYPWLEAPFNRLQSSWQSGRFHHALLLQGSRGMGKSALAATVAKGLLCINNTDLVPCGQCKSCLLSHAGSHPDLVAIDNGKDSIGIDEVRRVSDFVQKKSNLAKQRVIVIHAVEMLTESAANGLLKTLEEPAEHVYLILTCNSPQHLLATILSRCNQVTVNVGDTFQVYEYVRSRFNELSEQQCRTLLTLSGNAPLRVMAWLEELSVSQLTAGEQQYQQWRNGQLPSVQYAKTLEAGEFDKLLFEYLLKAEIEQRLTSASQDADVECFPLLNKLSTVQRQFNEAARTIKGQNKSLACLALLTQIEALLKANNWV